MLVGYEIVIANSSLCALLAFHHLLSNAHPWNNNNNNNKALFCYPVPSCFKLPDKSNSGLKADQGFNFFLLKHLFLAFFFVCNSRHIFVKAEYACVVKILHTLYRPNFTMVSDAAYSKVCVCNVICLYTRMVYNTLNHFNFYCIFFTECPHRGV